MIIQKCCVNNNKKCKQLSFLKINKYHYCLSHSILKFSKYAIKIQKNYRGYKCRRIIKNIYKNLPIDIQILISNKINYHHNTKKYYKTLNKIINNKISNIYLINNNILTYEYVFKIYYLSIKYFYIMDINVLNYMFNLCNPLTYYLNILIYPELIDDNINYNYKLYSHLDFYGISYDDIEYLIYILNIYSTNYYKWIERKNILRQSIF